MAESDAIQVFRAASIGPRRESGIRSMLTADERALYFDTARRHYRGVGRVIELGTWLGSGTFEIALGLEETGRAWRLTAMDRFVWYDDHARKNPAAGLAAGDSFMPLFRDNLAPFADRIDAVAGEIADIAALVPLAPQDRVELLFVDAPKTWKMLWQVLGHVGPHLVPGARIVFQDFFHLTSRQLIWLALSIPGLRLRAASATGTTAAFEIDGPVPDLAAVTPPTLRELGVPGLLAVWRRAEAEMPDWRRGEMAVGMALDLLGRGADAEATSVLRDGLEGASDRDAALTEVDRQIRKGDAGRREAIDLVRIRAFAREGKPLAAAGG